MFDIDKYFPNQYISVQSLSKTFFKTKTYVLR